MSKERNSEEYFKEPVKIYADGDGQLIEDRSGLCGFVEGSLPGLSGGDIGRITKQLSKAIEFLLEGRQPKNLVEISKDIFREGPTHNLRGKIDSQNSFMVSLRWSIDEQVPLEIFSIGRTQDRYNRKSRVRKRKISRLSGNIGSIPRFK